MGAYKELLLCYTSYAYKENVMEQVLIKEKRFEGRYVALEDLDHPAPIADGKNPQEVYESAILKGYPTPLIVYVPVQGMSHIY